MSPFRGESLAWGDARKGLVSRGFDCSLVPSLPGALPSLTGHGRDTTLTVISLPTPVGDSLYAVGISPVTATTSPCGESRRTVGLVH
jgi:hypothetical protein